MQVCFFCGSANGSNAKVCHSCSQPLAGGEEQASDNTENGTTEVLAECPYCGHGVESTDHECKNCESILVSSDPLDRPAPKSHEQEITSRYDEFAGRVQMVRDGRMSRGQFATWLGTVQQMLVGQRDRYIEMIRTSGYYDFSSDEVDMGMTGILDYEEAMEMMVLFAGDDEADMSILDAALEKMWDGNEKCNEAMRINRDFRAKLEEDWGYM
jgi:RNase P subunit RPR2